MGASWLLKDRFDLSRKIAGRQIFKKVMKFLNFELFVQFFFRNKRQRSLFEQFVFNKNGDIFARCEDNRIRRARIKDEFTLVLRKHKFGIKNPTIKLGNMHLFHQGIKCADAVEQKIMRRRTRIFMIVER